MRPKLAALAFAAAVCALFIAIARPWWTDHGFWQISRAAGITAYMLLSIDVLLGMAVRTRALERVLTRWRATDLHELLGVLGLAFLAGHVAALLGDQYIAFTVPELLVPLLSPYRPAWTALGILAMYATVVVYASVHLRRFIGYRAWRLIHLLAFPAFILSTLHGIFAGTDTRQWWAQAIYVLSASAFGALVTWRLVEWKRPAKSPRPPLANAPAHLS